MATREEAIQAIKDYPSIDKKIHDRREEILVPYNPFEDENIGGGRAENKKDESQEKMALKLASDNYLNKLHRQENAVCKVLHQCAVNAEPRRLDDTTYMIIDELYLKERRELTIEGIATRVNISRASVFRRRDAFLEAVKKELKNSK